MKVKITIKNQFHVLRFSLFLLLIITVTAIYLKLYYASLAMYGTFLFFFIPEIIIHINYFFKNNNTIYTIEENHIVMSYKKNELIIFKNQIKNIELVKPANLDDGWGIHSLGITYYFYLKMTLISGEEYYFTNLLDHQIDIIFSKYGYHFKRKNGIGWI